MSSRLVKFELTSEGSYEKRMKGLGWIQDFRVVGSSNGAPNVALRRGDSGAFFLPLKIFTIDVLGILLAF